MIPAAAAAKSLQSCPTLCDPIDGGSPLGCPVPGILQARTLEWVAISFSNAWKWKVKVKSLSRVRLLATPWTTAYQVPPSMGFSRQEYWTGVPLPSLWMIPTCKQTSKFCWCNDEPKHSPCFHSTHILVEEKTQTHVHWDSDAIQPSHPPSSHSPPTFNLSQHQDLFQWVSSSHQLAKGLEFRLHHQSFQWISNDFL